MGHFRRLFPDVCHLLSRYIGKYVHTTEREYTFDQIVVNLPQNAPEIVIFLKTFEIWVFFEKIDGFFEKKN